MPVPVNLFAQFCVFPAVFGDCNVFQGQFIFRILNLLHLDFVSVSVSSIARFIWDYNLYSSGLSPSVLCYRWVNVVFCFAIRAVQQPQSIEYVLSSNLIEVVGIEFWFHVPADILNLKIMAFGKTIVIKNRVAGTTV